MKESSSGPRLEPTVVLLELGCLLRPKAAVRHLLADGLSARLAVKQTGPTAENCHPCKSEEAIQKLQSTVQTTKPYFKQKWQAVHVHVGAVDRKDALLPL